MKTKVQRTVRQSIFLVKSLQLLKQCNSSNWVFCAVIILNLVNLILCNVTNGKDGSTYANESSIDALDLFEDTSNLVWSQFLEDYVLSQGPNSRTSKDISFMNNGGSSEMFGTSNAGHQMPVKGFGSMHNPQTPLNYHSSAYKRYIPTNNPNVYITKRIGEDVELEPHMRPPVKVVNPQFRPMTNQMIHQQHHQPGLLQSLFGLGGGVSTGPSGPPQQHQRPISSQQQQQLSGGSQTFRAVSENDLYLLGAIEKLVYRVDYLESRIRRSEQLIYYLMAGNNQKEVRDPCPTNFTRISENCYHINSRMQVNWKTANSACKALSAHLAEFEKPSENEEIMAYLLNQPNFRGRDYWLGGLNPGLLWIWSNSAKPVNPNMNLTSIAMSQKSESDNTTNTISELNENPDSTDQSSNETILNNTLEIKGQGRCLRLSYNSAKHSYMYFGQECTSRHNYICEYEDKTLDNKIKKIARSLNLNDMAKF